MKSIVAAAFSLTLASSLVHAETWNVTEGAGGETVRGEWTVSQSGPALNGVATMTGAHGRQLRYNVAGMVRDGGYMIQRVAPSDGVACAYVGQPRGKAGIAGTAVCNGASAPWTVLKRN